jgi:hypothetical protein
MPEAFDPGPAVGTQGDSTESFSARLGRIRGENRIFGVNALSLRIPQGVFRICDGAARILFAFCEDYRCRMAQRRCRCVRLLALRQIGTAKLQVVEISAVLFTGGAGIKASPPPLIRRAISRMRNTSFIVAQRDVESMLINSDQTTASRVNAPIRKGRQRRD